MKKLLIISYLLLLTCYFALGQTWDSVGSGVNGPVYAMAVYNGELYVGGQFSSAGGVPANNIAKWNGKNWSTVGSGLTYLPIYAQTAKTVKTLTVHNGILYAGGQFDTAGGIPAKCIAQWNGSTWDSVSNTFPGVGVAGINTLLWDDSVLFAGGGTGGGCRSLVYNLPPYGIYQWNGSSWSSLDGAGVSFEENWQGICHEGGVTNIATVNALTMYNNSLTIGGHYTLADSANLSSQSISFWNGLNWAGANSGLLPASLANTVVYTYGPYSAYTIGNAANVNALLNFNGTLYAGGDFQMSSGITCIAQWNGYSWAPVGYGILGVTVNALAAYNGHVFAGGYFYQANTSNGNGTLANSIAKWVDTAWQPVDSGVNVTGTIQALVEYNGALYAAGSFNTAGSLNVSNIAVYTEDSSHTKNVSEPLVSTVVYPNPNSGTFYVAAQNYPAGSHIEIYDVFGRKAFDELLAGNTTQVNLTGHVSQGIYMYRVKSVNNAVLSTGKFEVM